MILCSNSQIIEGMHFNNKYDNRIKQVIYFMMTVNLCCIIEPILLLKFNFPLRAEVRCTCVPLLKHTVIVVLNSINPG